MALVNVFVIPHGDEVISTPNPESRRMREAILEATSGDTSDTVVVVSPHSIRLRHSVALINTQYVRGYHRFDGHVLRRSYEVDRELNSKILSGCRNVEEVLYITASGPHSVFPLDFGSLIPLTFFRGNKRRVSVLGQWRDGSREDLIRFGRELYHTVEGSDRRVTVVFSADQAHTHSDQGPYGYSPNARLYDQAVVEALRSGDFGPLVNMPEEVVGSAKPDSYWNMLSFYGFIDEAHLRPVFKHYYVERYFGMLLATATQP